MVIIYIAVGKFEKKKHKHRGRELSTKPDFNDHFEVLFQRSFDIFPKVEFLVTLRPQMRLKQLNLYFIKSTFQILYNFFIFFKIYFNKFHKRIKISNSMLSL